MDDLNRHQHLYMQIIIVLMVLLLLLSFHSTYIMFFTIYISRHNGLNGTRLSRDLYLACPQTNTIIVASLDTTAITLVHNDLKGKTTIRALPDQAMSAI